jgi:hypothetical protein
MFRTHFLEKIKTNVLFKNVIRKLCRSGGNVEKLCRAGEVAHDDTIRRLLLACWITKATHSLRMYTTHYFSTASTTAQNTTQVLLYTCIIHLVSLDVIKRKWAMRMFKPRPIILQHVLHQILPFGL